MHWDISTPDSLINRINTTIKTHKPDGMVRCRLLHVTQPDIVGALNTLAHKWLCEKLVDITVLVKKTTVNSLNV